MPTFEQLVAAYGQQGANQINNWIKQSQLGDAYSFQQLQQFAPDVANLFQSSTNEAGQTIMNPNQTSASQPGTVSGPQGGNAPSGISPNDNVNAFVGGLMESPYYWTPAFQEIVSQFTGDAGRTLPNTGAATSWVSNFKAYAGTFANQFKNLTGRDPNAEEYNTFFQEVIVPMQPWLKTPDQLQVSQLATDTINKNFSSVVQQAAEDKAKQQAEAAVAPGSAFDIWQSSYNKAISDTELQLQDFQQKLFEKLRPNLLTSLQAQGLLDTGALNTAFAGAAKDLGESAQNYLAGVKSQAASDIAGKKYAIQSSPSNFALQNTFGVPGNLSAYGQQALQNAFNYNQQMNLANLQNAFQKEMLASQGKSSPLSQLGGLFVGSLAGGLGSSLGKSWGQGLGGGAGVAGGGWATGYNPQFGTVGTGYY